MSKQDYDFKELGIFAEKINQLAESVCPFYEEFVDDVVAGNISNIAEIERQLDFMLSYCFNNEILELYKKVLRKLYVKHPDTVQFYVSAYVNMYEKQDNDA